MKRKETIYWLLLLPGFCGLLMFYIVPFLFSFYYAVTDDMVSLEFAGARNFIDVVTNKLFLKAAVNTVIFTSYSVPLSMILGLLLAYCIQKLKRCKAVVALALLLPLVVPSGTITYFWRVLFDQNGLLLRAMIYLGMTHEAASQHTFEMVIVVIMFLWKNVSYNIVLFWSGLNWIPRTYYDQMALEGGGTWAQFRYVTWIYLLPTTFVALLMSIANSFKVYKEISMLYGVYPTNPDIYMVQHYMNNQFRAGNMQRLSAAAYIIFLAVSLVLLAVFYVQKRTTDFLI